MFIYDAYTECLNLGSFDPISAEENVTATDVWIQYITLKHLHLIFKNILFFYLLIDYTNAFNIVF